jgi:hypothetical protein
MFEIQILVRRNMKRNLAPDFVNWHRGICANDACRVNPLAMASEAGLCV